ncbi:FAD-dependent monooxygenase, partial [Acinetobacter baumannii]
LWIPQYKVEAALRARVAELPTVSVVWGARLEALSPGAGGVAAEIRDVETGATRTLRAPYLVGADGARSTVRGLLGI